MLLVLFAGYQAHWIFAERPGLAMEIDEASYFSQALDVADRVHASGLRGATTFYFDEGHAESPLLGAITVPILLVGSPSLRWSLMAQVAAQVTLLVATFLLARRLVGDPWSLLAVAVVGCSIGIIDYTRMYHFALLATATMTLAMWCLVASQRFTRPWPALGWGVAIGFALLSRTMMVALVPGLVLAGAVALVPGADRGRRAAWFAGGIGCAALVAGPWWMANWSTVSAYLTGYGYGVEGNVYGTLYSPLEPMYYLRIPYRMAQGFAWPLAEVLVVGLVIALVQAVRLARRQGVRAFVRRTIDQGHLLVAVVIASGIVSLMSSRNRGTGFELPLLPLVVVLAVLGFSRVRLTAVRWLLVGGLSVTLMLNAAVKSGEVPALAGPVNATFTKREEPIPIIDGRSHLEDYLEPSPYGPDADVTQVAEEVFDRVEELAVGDRPRVATQTGDHLLTVPFLEVVRMLRHDQMALWTVVGLEGDPPEHYRDQLDEGVTNPTDEFLITMDLDRSEALPTAADAPALEAGAAALGFVQVGSYRLPDGRGVRLWQRVPPVGEG